MKRALLALLAAALPTLADVGTEHFFTNALAVAEGATSAAGTFDVYNYTDGKTGFTLYNGGYVSEIVTGATGLGRHWQPFLTNGYLSVFNQMSTENRNKVGILTAGAACRLMLGSRVPDTKGTYYTLFRPRTDLDWNFTHRNTLWGFGHTGYSTLRCWKDKNSDDLLLDYTVKSGTPGNEHYVVAIDPGENGWKNGVWYLVAASFPGVSGADANAQARFWMRELDPRGTEFSPAPIVGVPRTGSDYVSYWPTAKQDNGKSCAFGSNCRMGLGAYLYNPGDNAGLIDGLGGDICYFRAENQYLDYSDFNDFFLSLGRPPDSTVVLFR